MSYEKNGYIVIKKFFSNDELKDLHSTLLIFHEAWTKDNSEFYSQKAINSAYITGEKYLDHYNRQKIFNFIGSSKIVKVLSSIIPKDPVFMNTQLFFNPVNKDQKNYWHRDPQYHLSLEEQKTALTKSTVLHFRIPLMDEPGIELIPGTHIRWDTDEELDVRLEKNGKKNHEDISSGVIVKLEKGDLLVFSSNMIHRGLYGMNRFALDLLFCDFDLEFANYIENSCLPSLEDLNQIEDPSVFKNSLKLMAHKI